eukprot:tig00021795_g23529.t1
MPFPESDRRAPQKHDSWGTASGPLRGRGASRGSGKAQGLDVTGHAASTSSLHERTLDESSRTGARSQFGGTQAASPARAQSPQREPSYAVKYFGVTHGDLGILSRRRHVPSVEVPKRLAGSSMPLDVAAQLTRASTSKGSLHERQARGPDGRPLSVGSTAYGRTLRSGWIDDPRSNRNLTPRDEERNVWIIHGYMHVKALPTVKSNKPRRRGIAPGGAALATPMSEMFPDSEIPYIAHAGMTGWKLTPLKTWEAPPPAPGPGSGAASSAGSPAREAQELARSASAPQELRFARGPSSSDLSPPAPRPPPLRLPRPLRPLPPAPALYPSPCHAPAALPPLPPHLHLPPHPHPHPPRPPPPSPAGILPAAGLDAAAGGRRDAAAGSGDDADRAAAERGYVAGRVGSAGSAGHRASRPTTAGSARAAV